MKLLKCIKILRWVLILILICIILVEISEISTASKYNGIDSIDVSHTSEKTFIRIYIEDTYVMGGEKYYIFKTSETGETEFTLSETDYNKYIGEGNDAVEGYVYKLALESELLHFTNKISHISDKHLRICTDALYNLNTESTGQVPLNDTDYKYYNTDLYSISITPELMHKIKPNTIIMSELKICRYSFLGENDFTDKEITTFKEDFDSKNLKIIEYFNQELKD